MSDIIPILERIAGELDASVQECKAGPIYNYNPIRKETVMSLEIILNIINVVLEESRRG